MCETVGWVSSVYVSLPHPKTVLAIWPRDFLLRGQGIAPSLSGFPAIARPPGPASGCRHGPCRSPVRAWGLAWIGFQARWL